MVTFRRPGDTPEQALEKVMERLRSIEGMGEVGLKGTTGRRMVQFYPPDQDVEFPSVVAFDVGITEIQESVIRLGPLGDRTVVDNMTQTNIDGEWHDVVLDSASEAGIMGFMDNVGIDLGDGWVADELRPHVRFGFKPEAWNIKIGEYLTFVEVLIRRFDEKFGTLEERMTTEPYRSYFGE